MSQVNTVGRVTADFELQMSANNVPYVRFSLVENIGYGESRKPQYLQVWAYGEDAARLAKSKAKKGSLLWISGELELEEFQHRDKTKDKRLKVKLDSWRFIHTKKPHDGPKDDSNTQADGTPDTSDTVLTAEELDGDRETLPD